MGSESLYQYVSGSGKYAQGTLSYTTGPTVTVNITSANAGWRIRGSNSNPDTSERISGYGTGTYTFSASDGESLAFQVYCTVEESYVGGQVFTIDFGNSGSSSGGSGSSGNYDGQYHNVYIFKDEGVHDVKVERTWSDFGDYTGKDGNYDRPVYLSSGDRMWYKDSFRITSEPLDGYTLDSYIIDEEVVNFYTTKVYYDNPDIGTWRVSFPHPENLYIYVTTTKIINNNFNNISEKKCINIAQASTNPNLFIAGNDDLIYVSNSIPYVSFTSFQFMTPDFSGVSKYIDFELGITNYSYQEQWPTYFVLTRSKDLMYQYCTFYTYQYFPNIPPIEGDDPGLIGWKYYYRNEFLNKIRFITKDLKPNTIYYLLTLSTNPNSFFSYDNVSTHNVKIGYTTGIFINNESNRDMYECFIDTPYIYHPQIISECNIIGHDTCQGYSYGAPSGYTPTYISNSITYWGRWTYSNRILYMLKFTTPSFMEEPNQICEITFNIDVRNRTDSDDTNPTIGNLFMRYAVCTSDINFNNYLTINTGEIPIDENRIAFGSFSEILNDINTFVVKNVELIQNTDYYLFIWNSEYCDEYTDINTTDQHSVVISYNDITRDPIQLSKYMRYQPYIDTGTTWEPL